MAVTDNGYLIKMTEVDDEIEKTIFVTYIRWVNATAINHSVTLEDKSSNELFYSVSDGPNFLDIHPLCRSVNGLKLASISSGTLYVYVR